MVLQTTLATSTDGLETATLQVMQSVSRRLLNLKKSDSSYHKNLEDLQACSRLILNEYSDATIAGVMATTSNRHLLQVLKQYKKGRCTL